MLGINPGTIAAVKLNTPAATTTTTTPTSAMAWARAREQLSGRVVLWEISHVHVQSSMHFSCGPS